MSTGRARVEQLKRAFTIFWEPEASAFLDYQRTEALAMSLTSPPSAQKLSDSVARESEAYYKVPGFSVAFFDLAKSYGLVPTDLPT
jgi:hypothetical protein